MPNYGINDEGFTIKGLDVILSQSFSRAQQMFRKNGVDVDLTDTSVLRKILQVTAQEDAELWKHMEDLYYGNFVSTAVGQSLDRLGEDVDLVRRNLFTSGEVTLKLVNGVAGRTYTLPSGTILQSGGRKFSTKGQVSLSTTSAQAKVDAVCLKRGGTDVPINQEFSVDPAYQQLYLALGQATITGTNEAGFSGATASEDDETYRTRLLSLPRNLWTLDSITRAAREVDGVIDVLAFDSLGGVDVSQNLFNQFKFEQRPFGASRNIGEPYYFDLVIAHEASRPWTGSGGDPGVFEQVSAAVDRVRPVGIYPNVIEADHIRVGLQGTVVAQGVDTVALLATIKQRLSLILSLPRLGGEVRYSQVMRSIAEQSGVVDVSNLHLRRYPPQFARFSFGAVPFQSQFIEAAAGENLVMGPREIALFQPDNDLFDIEVTAQ
jgi:uncharacterized phage protein gp47/JayE